MSAVDGEDLELAVGDAADPAGDLGGVAVVEGGGGRPEAGETGFADGEVVDAAESDPGARGGVLLPQRRAEQVADQWNGEDKSDGGVQRKREVGKAPRKE